MRRPLLSGVSVRYLLLSLLLSLPFAVQAEEDWGDASTAFDSPDGKPKYEDPWEDINRKIFAFNEALDKYGLKPVAKGYDKVTPQWMNDTITRFYENLRDFRSGLNSVLQWRWGHVGQNWGRFAVNTTLGIGGLFDVASKVELEKRNTDLGLTFARWGVPEGPFMMLPFFGPSTGRDAAAILPEDYMRLRHYIPHDLTATVLPPCMWWICGRICWTWSAILSATAIPSCVTLTCNVAALKAVTGRRCASPRLKPAIRNSMTSTKTMAGEERVGS